MPIAGQPVNPRSDYEVRLLPPSRWQPPDLAGLWHYRDLLSLLVWRDFVSRYKQTVLGPLWFIVQPLVMTAVFAVVFSGAFGISTDGLPPVLFYLCGQLGWSYFAQTLTTNSTVLVTNAGIFSKVYFPRLIVPLSVLTSNLITLAVQAATFFVFLAGFKLLGPPATYGVSGGVVFLPLIILQIAALSLGVGLLLAAMTAKYRDLTHLTTLLIQVWMYATPVIYPLAAFPAKWRWVAALNPMTPIVESLRLVLLGTGTVEPLHLIWSIAATFVMLVSGLLLFTKIERTFVDII